MGAVLSRARRRTARPILAWRPAPKTVYSLVVAFALIGVEQILPAVPNLQGGDALNPHLPTATVANGHTLLLEITQRDSMPVDYKAARRDTTAVHLYPRPGVDPNASFALIGIPYETKPGPDTLSLEWSVGDNLYTRDIPFRIVSGPYKAESIKGVDQSRVAPDVAALKRIAEERKIIAAANVAVRDTVMMGGSFEWPVKNRVVTSAYGTRRVFNGQLRSFHGGLDLRAREGTSVYAAQSGVVKLARNLFYSGNHVLVEHGMGLHTSYSHFSRIEVTEGQWVEKGQLVGLAGATGRVNAAHLHWTTNVNGVGVSPLQCVEIIEAVFGRKTEEKQSADSSQQEKP